MDIRDFMPGEEVVVRIKADIAAYEAERRQVMRALLWRVPVFVGGVLALVAAVALVFNVLADPFEQWFSAPHMFLYFIGIVTLYFAYIQAVRPSRRLKQSFRERVLPAVFVFIDQLGYKNGEKPYSFERMPQEVTGKFTLHSFGDMISGQYDGFGFELFETTLAYTMKKSSVRVFKGVVVAFGAVAPFPGLLVATPRKSTAFGFVRRILGGKTGEMRSGNDVIDARYKFTTDNVQAARPLVSGRMAQALQWLVEGWPNRPARVALRGDSGFLLIPHEKDFFALPSISRALDYQKHIAPMIADLGALLATAALVRKISVPDEVPVPDDSYQQPPVEPGS